ncbi:MAG: CoA-binding protein [Bacillota bacterium]
MTTKKHFLDHFFYPESIALIGASANPAKAGYQVLSNLTTLGYPGRIYPVNPAERVIENVQCYGSVAELPESPELAIIAVQAKNVVPVVHQLAERGGTRGLVVISAGFAETQKPENAALQEELVRVAGAAGMRVFGPNCTGVINTANNLDTTIEPIVRRVPGRIGAFSQSGAVGGALLLMLEDQPEPVGFSKWAHVGNMSDVNCLDVLEYYGYDEATEVILLYLEGLDDGRRFMTLARDITRRKPVVVLKVGRNEYGSRAAFSHTGAMAGVDLIYDAAFQQCGVMRVDHLEEWIDTAKVLALQPVPAGNRICILTEAGGPGTMAMDELGRNPAVRLAHISDEGVDYLQQVLPSMAMVCKPDGYIDITAAAMEEHHVLSLKRVLAEPGVDGVVFITVPPTFLSPGSVAREVIPVIKNSPKPVAVCFLAGRWVREARRMLEREGIPTFETPDRAVRAMIRLVERCQYLERSRSGVDGHE